MNKPFEINDRVFDPSFGWGTVISTARSEKWKQMDFPFPFRNEVEFDDGSTNLYNVNGKAMCSALQSLFFEEPIENLIDVIPIEYNMEITKKNGYDFHQLVSINYSSGKAVRTVLIESFDLEFIKFTLEQIKVQIEIIETKLDL